MFTEFFKRKILSLNDSSGRLSATVLSDGDSTSWCCDLIPRDLSGGALELVSWVAGDTIASHLEAALDLGGQALDPIISIKGNTLEVASLASFEVSQFRLTLEKFQPTASAGTSQPDSAQSQSDSQGQSAAQDQNTALEGQEDLPSNQAFVLAFSGKISIEGLAEMGGDLVIQIRRGAPFVVQFQPHADAQFPSISVPLPGIGPDLEFHLSVSAFDLVREKRNATKTLALIGEGQAGIKGGPDWLDKVLPDNVLFNLALTKTADLSNKSKMRMSLSIPKLMDAVDVSIPAIPQIISIPGIPHLSLGTVNLNLSDLSVIKETGESPALAISCGIGLPDELNRIAGSKSNGEPRFAWAKTFDPENPDETRVEGRFIASGKSIEFKLLDSPIKAIQTQRKSNIPGNNEGSVWVLDLGDNGLVHIDLPSFSKPANSSAFATSGGFDIKRSLSLPLTPIKSLIDTILFKGASSFLPDNVPIKSIDLLDGDELNVDGLRDLVGGKLPGVLEDLISSADNVIEHLPDSFKSYLRFSIPDSLHYDFRMNADGSCAGGIYLPDDEPLRVLIPAYEFMMGLEIRGVSLGQLNGGQLGVLEFDASIDLFYLPEMLLGTVLNMAEVPKIPDSNDLSFRMDYRDIVVLIHFASGIFFPVFWGKSGGKRLGAEGIGFASSTRLPKPEADLLDLIHVAAKLADFLTLPASHPKGLLNPDEPMEVLKTEFAVGEVYLQTPEYLGDVVLGKKGEDLFKVESKDLWPYLAHMLNFCKTHRIDEFLQAFPLDLRVGNETLDFFGLASINVAWLVSSPKEFREEAYRRLALAPSDGDAVLTLLPDSSNDNRLVTIAHGGFALGPVELTCTQAFSGGFTGASSGFRFTGEIADIVELEVAAKVGLEAQPPTFAVAGESQLAVLGHTVLQGKAGIENDKVYLSGKLDLFPDSNVLSLQAEIDGQMSSSGVLIRGATDLKVGGVSVIQGELLLTHTLLKVYGQCLGLEAEVIVGDHNGQLQISGALGFSRGIGIKTGAISIQGIKVSDPIELEVACDIGLRIGIIGDSFVLGAHVDFDAFGESLSIDFDLNVMPKDIEDFLSELPGRLVDAVEDTLKTLLNRPEKLLEAIAKTTLAVTNTSVNAISIENGDNDFGLVNLNNRFFNATALATYSGEPKLDNLFAYAQMNQSSFRMPAFKIDSIALALACNRAANLPRLGRVKQFPLVKRLNDNTSIGESDSPADIQKAKNAINNLLSVLPHRRGVFTWSAGMKGNSFKLMQFTNVFMLEAGRKNKASLVGTAHMQLPPKPITSLVNLEFDYRASIDVGKGNILIDGKLSNNSYLFTKAVKVTGGFAYYAWASGQHAGDFVMTIGGYAPGYSRPGHYPNIPRVGFNWDLAKFIGAKGEMYSALTPKELMLGGALHLSFQIRGSSANKLLDIADQGLGTVTKVTGISGLVDMLPESIKSMTQTTELLEASASTKIDVYMPWYPMAYKADMTFEMKAELKLKQVGTAVFEIIEKVWGVVDEVPILRKVKSACDWIMKKVGVTYVYGWIKNLVERAGNFVASKLLSPSVSVDFHIWGPRIGGYAALDCKFFELTLPISNASRPSTNKAMYWNDFYARYLSESTPEMAVKSGGLSVREHGGKRWHIVDPDQVEITCRGQAPISEIVLKSNGDKAWSSTGRSFYLPLLTTSKNGARAEEWSLDIAYEGPGGMYFQGKPKDAPYPSAVYGKRRKPSRYDASTRSLLSGADFVPRPGKPPGFTDAVDADEFKHQDVVEHDPTWQWGDTLKQAYSADLTHNEKALRDSIDTASSQSRRQRLADFVGLTQKLDVTGMANNPQSTFIGMPQSATASLSGQVSNGQAAIH